MAAESSITEALPFLKPLFQMEGVIASVFGVGERVMLRRLPRALKQLPPQQWTEERSSTDKILVVVHLKRGDGKSNPLLAWLPGTSAPPPVLARLLFGHLGSRPWWRNSFCPLGCALGMPLVCWMPLCGVWGGTNPFAPLWRFASQELTEGWHWGTFRVPSEEAFDGFDAVGAMVCSSGPFSQPPPRRPAAKSDFNSLVKTSGAVDADALNQLWETLKEIPGVLGLVLGSKDVGVRVDRTMPSFACLGGGAPGEVFPIEAEDTQRELVVPQEYGGRRPVPGRHHSDQVWHEAPRRVEEGEGWALPLEDFLQGGVRSGTPLLGQWFLGCLPTLACGSPPTTEGQPKSRPL